MVNMQSINVMVPAAGLGAIDIYPLLWFWIRFLDVSVPWLQELTLSLVGVHLAALDSSLSSSRRNQGKIPK